MSHTRRPSHTLLASIRTTLLFLLLLPAITSCAGNGPEAPADQSLSAIKLPPGFHIELYIRNVSGARSMAVGANGTLFVGTRGSSVYAITNGARPGSAHTIHTIARNLRSPNGVAFRSGALYVAEINRVIRFDGIESRLENPPEPVVVNDKFPGDDAHGWKFIRFGPDGKLYVPVGAPCNVCLRDDKRYASLMRMNADGSGLEVYASGIRNTVGFDWDPATKELWFTDNGRDMLGDDKPPDELNHAPKAGMNFGFPYLHGKDIMDPEFGKGHSPSEFTPPAQELGPHVASLGMRFYTGSMFPAQYKNRIFIAEHGSWNRSTPIGYRVTMVTLQGNTAIAYEPFAEGWLQGRNVSGRPVDVEVLQDGSILVSDDQAGVIYRITYRR